MTVVGGRDCEMVVGVAFVVALHPSVVPLARPLARELPDV